VDILVSIDALFVVRSSRLYATVHEGSFAKARGSLAGDGRLYVYYLGVDVAI
jgi:hypothetical protein